MAEPTRVHHNPNDPNVSGPCQGKIDPDGYCQGCHYWAAGSEPDALFAHVKYECAGKARFNFWVPGLPGPGGSKTFVPIRNRDDTIKIELKYSKPKQRMREQVVGRYIDEGGSRTKAWRLLVAGHAQYHAKRAPLLDGPIGWVVVFYQRRPKHHYRTGKYSDILKDDAPAMPIVNPDLTKLLRPTEDALKGILWTDDNRIATEFSGKRYGPESGARIIVWEC